MSQVAPRPDSEEIYAKHISVHGSIWGLISLTFESFNKM